MIDVSTHKKKFKREKGLRNQGVGVGVPQIKITEKEQVKSLNRQFQRKVI